MIGDLGVHGAHDAHVVHASAEIGEHFGDLDAALAILLELEGRLHQGTGLALMPKITARHRLAVVLGQHRLGIEAVVLAESAK